MAVTAASSLVGAGAAGAATTQACGARSDAQVFSKWNDKNEYFAMPDGGFESGTGPWTLTGGAAVVSGNETYKVGGSSDSHSLRMPFGATATSQTICVSQGEDSIRLFANNGGVSGAILHVDAVAKNTNGQTGYASFDVNADAAAKGWSPTMALQLPNLFNTTTGTMTLTLEFSTRGSAATWSVDDVYVDPFRST